MFTNTVAPELTTECKFLMTFQKKDTFKYLVPFEEGNRTHSIVITKMRYRTENYRPHSLTTLNSSSKIYEISATEK